MSVRLDALRKQMAKVEEAIPGIGVGHAHAYGPETPPEGDQLPAIFNVYAGHHIAGKELQLPGQLAVWYNIVVFLAIGPYEDYAGEAQAAPFVGPILAALRKDPKFKDATTNIATCNNSLLEDQDGTAGRHWYRGSYYYGVTFPIKCLIFEPTNQ